MEDDETMFYEQKVPEWKKESNKLIHSLVEYFVLEFAVFCYSLPKIQPPHPFKLSRILAIPDR